MLHIIIIAIVMIIVKVIFTLFLPIVVCEGIYFGMQHHAVKGCRQQKNLFELLLQ